MIRNVAYLCSLNSRVECCKTFCKSRTGYIFFTCFKILLIRLYSTITHNVTNYMPQVWLLYQNLLPVNSKDGLQHKFEVAFFSLPSIQTRARTISALLCRKQEMRIFNSIEKGHQSENESLNPSRKFPAFYITWKLIIFFTRDCFCTSDRWVQPTPSHQVCNILYEFHISAIHTTCPAHFIPLISFP